jgi:hypothetical protein
MAMGGTAALGTRTRDVLAAVPVDFPDGLSVTLANSVRRRFRLSTRSAQDTSFPIPTVQPVASDSVIAFDIMPSGAPTAIPDEGIAWLDVCDADVSSEERPVGTARVGVSANSVEFGARFYGGAASRPVHVTSGTVGDRRAQPAIRIDPWGERPGRVVLGADGSNVVVGSGYSIPSEATRGFAYIQAINGPPTGAPEAAGATNPLVYDRTTKCLCIYDFDDARWRIVGTS